MNAPALVLAVASTLLLAAGAWLSPGGIAPSYLPVALIALGAVPASYAAAKGQAHVHAGGAVVQLVGIALTGPFVASPLVLVGTLGVVLAVGSWTIGQSTRGGIRPARVSLVALATGLLAALIGWGIAGGLAGLAAGGVDARASLPAWLVLAVASTWLLFRWTGGVQDA